MQQGLIRAALSPGTLASVAKAQATLGSGDWNARERSKSILKEAPAERHPAEGGHYFRTSQNPASSMRGSDQLSEADHHIRRKGYNDMHDSGWATLNRSRLTKLSELVSKRSLDSVRKHALLLALMFSS